MLSSNLRPNATANEDMFGFSMSDIKAEVKRAHKLVGQIIHNPFTLFDFLV